MSTTSSAAPLHRATSPTANRTVAATTRASAEPVRTLTMGTEEAQVLNLDLTGLQIPKVGGMQVDGFKPTFFERLFGKR